MATPCPIKGGEASDDQLFSVDVFLGGACGASTWRKDIAIPLLRANGITYWNPQVDDWHPGLLVEENFHKETANILLFIVDGTTRGVASMIETAEYLARGREVVLVMQDLADPTFIEDKNDEIKPYAIRGSELNDLNRGRKFLADLTNRMGHPVHDTVEGAIRSIPAIIEKIRAKEAAGETKEATEAEKDAAAAEAARLKLKESTDAGSDLFVPKVDDEPAAPTPVTAE